MIILFFYCVKNFNNHLKVFFVVIAEDRDLNDNTQMRNYYDFILRVVGVILIENIYTLKIQCTLK